MIWAIFQRTFRGPSPIASSVVWPSNCQLGDGEAGANDNEEPASYLPVAPSFFLSFLLSSFFIFFICVYSDNQLVSLVVPAIKLCVHSY